MPEVIEFPALKEAQGKLDAKRAELHTIFAEAGSDMDMAKVKSISGDNDAKVEAIRSLNAEVEDCQKAVEKLLVVQKGAENASKHDEHTEKGAETDPAELKSLGESYVKSAAFGKKDAVHVVEGDVKSVFLTTAGWAPQTLRTGHVQLSAQRPVQVLDLIPHTTTSQAAIVYMEETTFTNNAAEVAEAGAYGEAALALTQRSVTVRKVGVWLPITDEQLDDEPQAQGYINNRIPFMLNQRLDQQVLVGDNTGVNLNGIYTQAGQTQAKGADPGPDAIYKAIVKGRVTGRSFPNAVVMHPTDWQNIRLLRTADGIYIWGSPSDAGPDRIWGLPVTQADSLTVSNALVGDFANQCELSMRRGIEMKMTDAHDVFFINGKQAIRADVRCAVVVYRPNAFVKVTGL